MIRGVPYDAEIEYLESTGTQWIEAWSGVTDNTFGLLAEFSCDYTDDNYPAGFSTVNNKRFLFWGPYTTTWHYGWGNISASSTTPGFPLSQYPNRADVFYRASVNYLNSGVVTFADDTPYQLPTVPNFTNTDFRLFRSFSTPVKCRFKFAIVSKGAAIVRDFIPVRVGQVGYMYDRVTRKLFGNAGTGSFVLGPDVARPVMGLRRYKPTARNYVQDGLVAMWDGIENAGWGVHNPNATTWADLTGNGNNLIPYSINNLRWGDNSPYVYAHMYNSSFNIDVSVGFTIEACVSKYIDVTRYGPQSASSLYLSFNSAGYAATAALDSASGGWNGDGPTEIGRAWNEVLRNTNINTFRCVGENENTTFSCGEGQLQYTRPNYPASGVRFFKIGGGNGALEYGGWHNIRIYSRALTAAEMSANYAIDKIRFNLP